MEDVFGQIFKKPAIAGILIGLGALAINPCPAPAQPQDVIIVESGLHDSQHLSGIDASSAGASFPNKNNRSVTGSGDASGAYSDVSFSLWGIRADAAVDIKNIGSISLKATGGSTSATSNADGAGADVFAYGIGTRGDVTNSGAVSASVAGGAMNATNAYTSALAEAYGIKLATGNAINSGPITARAVSGTVNATYTAPTFFPYAYTSAYGAGIYVQSGNVTNTGAMAASATGGVSAVTDAMGSARAYAAADATGIDARAGDVLNTGGITATARGGTASGGSTADADADATGIYAGDGNVTNTGAITATATGGRASGTTPSADADACGIDAARGHTVTNSGDITVRAQARNGFGATACGIRFRDSGTLTNTGIILAAADTAYEVSVISGTVTLAGTYNLTLDGDPDIGSFYVAAGAGLDLNHAALGVSSAAGKTLWETGYRIFQAGAGASVTGSFEGATARNPNIRVTYDDQATAGSSDDTVSISYRPMASPVVAAAGFLGRTITLAEHLVGQHLAADLLDTALAGRMEAPLYADAGTVACDGDGYRKGTKASAGFFFTPYFAGIDHDNAPLGYKAKTAGFVAGWDRLASGGRFDYGFHLGLGRSGLDFTGTGYDDADENQTLFSAGLHAMGNHHGWTWRGQASGFHARHRYRGRTGANLDREESADYNSYGASATLMAGHLFRPGKGYRLLPEAGLDYLWMHRNSFTTATPDAPGFEVVHGTLDQHRAAALASLRLTTHRRLGNMTLTPSAAAGLRSLLSRDEIEANQGVTGAAPVTLNTSEDDLSVTVSASVTIANQSDTAVKLAYEGRYGDTTTMHGLWLRFSFGF